MQTFDPPCLIVISLRGGAGFLERVIHRTNSRKCSTGRSRVLRRGTCGEEGLRICLCRLWIRVVASVLTRVLQLKIGSGRPFLRAHPRSFDRLPLSNVSLRLLFNG